MGTLRKVVTLAEGAKPGVPNLNIAQMGHNYAELEIEVWFFYLGGFDLIRNVRFKQKVPRGEFWFKKNDVVREAMGRLSLSPTGHDTKH